MIKTLVSQKEGEYAAFPTFTSYQNKLYLFYRRGYRSRLGTHGKGGQVMLSIFDHDHFLEKFDHAEPDALARHQAAIPIFQVGNEHDAVVSNLGEAGFTLATRTFTRADERYLNDTYLSKASRPEFARRQPVVLPTWKFVNFYGKAFLHNGSILMPAYGFGGSNPQTYAFLVSTPDGIRFREHALIFKRRPDLMLNETSIVHYQGKYHAFLRRDDKPYGIWHSSSEDTLHWEEPKQLIEAAHAPMADVGPDGTCRLIFRLILGPDEAATAIMEPFTNPTPQIIETYQGSIFDGGYGDIGWIGNRLFVIYYHGNREGEPFIRCWSPS